MRRQVEVALDDGEDPHDSHDSHDNHDNHDTYIVGVHRACARQADRRKPRTGR